MDNLTKELLNAEAVKRLIDSEDYDLLVDSVEGQTQFMEVLDSIHESILADDANIAGINAVMEKLSARIAAAKWRQEKARKAIFGAMIRLGLNKIKRPTATFSVKKGAPKVEIYDEKEIPSQFYRNVPQIEKAALAKALKEGESIPGAHLVEGQSTLAIRT